MTTQRFALVLGIIFLVIGAAGFIPALVTAPMGDVAVDAGHGRLFGLFPVNLLHNLFHLAFGIWGVLAYKSFAGARTYSQVTAVVYGILVVMGLIPVLRTVFGLIPIYGHDIWLHALIALAAAYFGFVAARPTPVDVRTDAGRPATTRTETRPRP